MKKILYVLISLVLALIPLSVNGIADPDTPPQVSAVYVYEDLLEDGDLGVLMDIYLDYAALPTETATEAYLGVFVDIDGTTQLDAVAPYAYSYGAYNDLGYGRNLIWIYFTAAEVITYSIDSADVLLYSVWLTGNPTVPSGWAGDPPKTTAGIDYWMSAGADANVLMALRVLYYAQVLETIWGVDLVESTALGNRLTAQGEDYFQNVIPNLRDIAPNAFASVELQPTLEQLDYSTEFGAILSDGTGTLTAGSPQTLVEGANTIQVAVAGTFELLLSKGTSGTAVSGTAVLAGSPVTLNYQALGEPLTLTVAIGAPNQTIVITVNLDNTQTAIDDATTGTPFDLSTLATAFGINETFLKGIVWLLISILICWGVVRATQSNTKILLIVFDVCIIGGALLGMMPVIVAVLMFIGFGVFTGYILFFKSSGI